MHDKIWDNGLTQEITFIVTKDCQLACKYCYLVGKNSSERMTATTAKEAVDFILSQEYDEFFASSAVVFDFIGGEPFLEIDLIDEVCDYLGAQMKARNHHWRDSYLISLTTNGINYDSPKVQNFIRKNRERLHITVTIDGTRRKHDMNRIWKTAPGMPERGSYDSIVKNVPLWLSQFPDAATKVTISSADIPYVAESVLHLFSLGIKNVHINCVFEDVWKEGDDILFERQLTALADAIIDYGYHSKGYECTLFDETIGYPLSADADRNWCGAGRMLAIDAGGNLYPCTRFAQYSLREKKARMIGHLKTGIDKDKVRPFYALSRQTQSRQECIECEVASGCAWCQGENYDAADSPTIFQRSIAICRMHKARVRANRYYRNRIGLNEGNQPEVNNRCTIDKEEPSIKYVNVLLTSDSVLFCKGYPVGSNSKKSEIISVETLKHVIDLSVKKGWSLNFIYPKYELQKGITELIERVPQIAVKPNEANGSSDVVVCEGIEDFPCKAMKNVILRIKLEDFQHRQDSLKRFLEKSQRVNIIFVDEMEFNDTHEAGYQRALETLTTTVYELWKKGHEVKINLLTDRLFLSNPQECGAGSDTITLAPTGDFYICPVFYYDDPSESCGNIFSGLKIKNPLLYKRNHSPICKDCNAFQCQRCIYLNYKKTLEVNIPSFSQCKKSSLELEVTKRFYRLLTCYTRQEGSHRTLN